MREDAFDTAYRRLAATRVAIDAVRGEGRGRGRDVSVPSAARDRPHSRLLPRLALLAPGRALRLRDATD